ncbi:LIC12162 family protein [Propionivibrio sp.]|uniref:LIC12162 family transferase n=1 Tax=Propionivibrio sp. TaxID=2212460 RepID=UPI0026114D52|nr:LIC12162 family protein [Propionivibrio sp.]
MKISNINIRATALNEFWSDEYSDSLYLWQGAKHTSTLKYIENDLVPTNPDLFSTKEEIQEAHDVCKNFYYKILPELARRLNTIHNLELPVSFWEVVFGYWLFRHISIVYEKYVYLSALDIDATGIKILNKSDFNIPKNHVDYIFCFAGDFGVQQLVSQYYHLYKTKDFEIVRLKYTSCISSTDDGSMLFGLRRKIALMQVEPQIALLNVVLSKNNRKVLEERSQGRVNSFSLPRIKRIPLDADFTKRKFITRSTIERSFESYFMQSLYYCLPMDFLEYFMGYYSVFKNDIKCRKFTHIVSECWISNVQDAIYVALAKEDNRKFICYEHSSGTCYYKNYMQFMDYEASDIYLSVGWKGNIKNLIQGGFACRDVIPYQFDPKKKSILFITRTKFIYGVEINEYSASNSTFIRELKTIADIITLLPSALIEHFLFRPRQENGFWDVEHLLELEKLNIKIDRGSFNESIIKSKIVIIDHMSSGFSEILLMKVPFILVCDISCIPLSGELKEIFDDLIDCGVIHASAQSTIAKLSSIYDNVEDWWFSEAVRHPVERLTDYSLAPESKTTDYFLSLLPEGIATPPNLQNRFLTKAILCAKSALSMMNKIITS